MCVCVTLSYILYMDVKELCWETGVAFLKLCRLSCLGKRESSDCEGENNDSITKQKF